MAINSESPRSPIIISNPMYNKTLIQQFIDSSDDAILILRLDHESSLYNICYINPKFMKSHQNMWPQRPKHPINFQKLDPLVIDNINTAIYERNIVHTNLKIGSEVEYIHGYPMNDIYYVILIRSITDSYNQREDIKRNKNLLEGVFESSFSALCVTDPIGFVIRYNRRFAAHLLTNYEYTFQSNYHKNVIWELPCFSDVERNNLKNYYGANNKIPIHIGSFYFTPYIVSEDEVDYILVELRLDHHQAYKEAALSKIIDPIGRTLLDNVESDLIRMQQRIFEDKDSVVTQIDKLSIIVSELSRQINKVEEIIKPIEDANTFFNVLSWCKERLPWKIIFILAALYGGIQIPSIDNYILENIFEIDVEDTAPNTVEDFTLP